MEGVVSAFIASLFDKLASSDLLQLAREEQLLSDIENWENTLLKFRAVLDDAEERQLTNLPVKLWLDDLRELAFDVEEILDELAIEASERKLIMAETQTQPQASTSRLQKFIPSFCTNFSTPSTSKFNVKMRFKIEAISSKFQLLSERMNDLHLAEITLSTTSFIDVSTICGMGIERAAILKLLLDDDAVLVIAIIGKGGVGKTALAQLAYNHEKVRSHFDPGVWVCVSYDFDVLRITKTILECVTSYGVSDANHDLNQLQLRLKEQLSGKKFLLVLDDVWSQDSEKWDLLLAPVRTTGARGSKVIVTTRIQWVVSAIGGATSAYPLQGLSDEECLSLLAQQALGSRNFYDYPKLRVLGEQIAKKCNGLPLAAKTFGRMLRTNQNPDAWENLLRSKIWGWGFPNQEKNNIFLALKLSYHRLPSHLKRCFAYCSIFPKDYEFKVDELVLLWMGEGFLDKGNEGMQMEEIGTKCFQELLARKFFQQSNCTPSHFVILHDAHELARSVAGYTCFDLEDKEQHTISERARYASFICREYTVSGNFKAFGEGKTNLQTLISLPRNNGARREMGYISQNVLHDLLMGMRCLRVLSLAGYHVREVPDLIGRLEQLRYLNFSNCSIERLPDSVGHLDNLQTLILRDCSELITLPKGIGKLKNLRHPDITGTSKLQQMPFQVGELTNLQTLSRFIVSKSGGSGIRELKNLSNLQGGLSISKLHEIKDVEDARDANMNDKQKLVELIMGWNNEFWDSRNGLDELKILEYLQPHKNLEKLTVEFYGGSKFPSWIGDPSFSKMVCLTLQGCNKCRLLPALGGLPLLKVLHIQGLGKVKSIGYEFYGGYMNPFASLKELLFENMPEWENWSHSNLMKKNIRVFPKLEKFAIRKCPKLKGEIPKCLQSLLVKLDMSDCPKMVRGLPPRMMGHTRYWEALQKLVIKDCGGLTCLWEEQGEGELLCNLKILMIRNCANLKKLPNGLYSVKNLGELEIEGCPKLESFPEMGLPPMLRRFVVKACGNLAGLPHSYNSIALESLMIDRCRSLTRFPNGELPTTLKELYVKGCENLESLPEGIMMQVQHNSCALESLEIMSCPSLICFPSGELPTTLKRLSIINCENLESLPVAVAVAVAVAAAAAAAAEGKNMKIHHNSTCSLEFLKIKGCQNLECFTTGELLLPSTLKRLEISYCSNLELMSEKMCPNNSALEHLGLQLCPNLRTLPECLNSLKELHIGYCDGLEYFPAAGLSTPNLTLLHIIGCRKLKSLPHQMRNLNSLTELCIIQCPVVESFPEEGLPPNLTSLEVGLCENLKMLVSDWGLQSFTSLSELAIMHMFPDMVSFPDENRLLPSSLNFLKISGMGSLTSLPLPKLNSLTSLQVSEMASLASLPLQNLTSLKSLYISDCPKLCSLGLLPEPLETLETLETLDIHDCPILKKRCLKGEGDYFPNIAHIPLIRIDKEHIHGLQNNWWKCKCIL